MQGWSKRIVALAFIGLILLGNIWLVSILTHSETPGWTAIGFYVCIMLVAFGAIGMLIARLMLGPEGQT